MKKLKFLTAFAAILLALSLLCASAAAYFDASSRIRFYYQYEGGGKDVQGTWDKLIADRLYSLYKHSTIYMDSTTSKYLTGRGCCLFTFSHAYQFLCGKASGQSAQATILYNFLKQKPVWANTGSSMSPPNAASIYHSALNSQSGVTAYSVSSLSSFSALKAFFSGNRGCVVVNAPGHYVLAVGATTYNGTDYVQIVDSVLSGTIRSGRCTLAKSMDFSVTYTPTNAESYTQSVHQYWLPYSQFSSKCTMKYAYKTSNYGGTETPVTAKKTSELMVVGGTADIVISGNKDTMVFTSTDTSVVTVTSSGRITAVGAGTAGVICTEKSDSSRGGTVKVTVFEPYVSEVKLLGEGDSLADTPEGLPANAVIEALPVPVTEPGIYETQTVIKDSYGDVVYTYPVKGVYPDPETSFFIPDSVRYIENEAFSEVAAEYFIVPESVVYIGARVFENSGAKAIILLNPEIVTDEEAFVGLDCLIYPEPVY